MDTYFFLSRFIWHVCLFVGKMCACNDSISSIIGCCRHCHQHYQFIKIVQMRSNHNNNNNRMRILKTAFRSIVQDSIFFLACLMWQFWNIHRKTSRHFNIRIQIWKFSFLIYSMVHGALCLMPHKCYIHFDFSSTFWFLHCVHRQHGNVKKRI